MGGSGPGFVRAVRDAVRHPRDAGTHRFASGQLALLKHALTILNPVSIGQPNQQSADKDRVGERVPESRVAHGDTIPNEQAHQNA